MMTLVKLYFAFLQAGLFAMGGGLAIIPFLSNMIDKYYWFTAEDLRALIALAEITPGALGINMATYAGFLAGGVLGGLFATLGLVTPSIILVSLLAKLWRKVKRYKAVRSVFNSIKCSVVGLIIAIFYGLFLPFFRDTDIETRQGMIDWMHNFKIMAFFFVALLLLQIPRLPLAGFMFISGVLGVLWFY